YNMKKPIGLFNLIGAAILSMASFSLFAQSTQAAPQYQCVSRNGKYFTVVRTSRGPVPIIEWVNSYGKEYTKERRCKDVSNRFQFFTESGQLKYLATGTVSKKPVICGVSERGQKCDSNNMLVQLPDGSDRYKVARQLIMIHQSNGNRVRINETRIEVYQNGENYYDIELILNNAAPINK
ncbi:MAG TPA: COP23 domain-containing protein, partial [Allocoleopsis sp.]